MSSTSEPSDPFFCSLSDFTGGTPPARSNYCGSPEDAFPTDPKGCQGSNFFFFFPSSCSSAILTVIMLYSFKWFHGRRPCSSPRLEVFLGGGTSVNIFNLKEKTQPPLFSGVTAIEVQKIVNVDILSVQMRVIFLCQAGLYIPQLQPY